MFLRNGFGGGAEDGVGGPSVAVRVALDEGHAGRVGTRAASGEVKHLRLLLGGEGGGRWGW